MTRTRDEIELDLAFLVNGTLDDTARAELEALAEGDARIAAERDALSTIRAEMQAEEVQSPGAFGLARLMRDIDRESERAGTALAGPPAPSRTWIWQAAAAVAVVALLAQGLLLRGAGEVERFELAGAGMPGSLMVSFAPDASEAQIRGVLLDSAVEIVGGPSALGLYRLEPLEGVTADEAAQTLRAAQNIVESVENAGH
jgi:anti-sigma factor RsiW